MGIDYWNVGHQEQEISHTYVLKSLDCVDDQKGFEAYCMTRLYDSS
jgi:hypothetical protein